MATHRFRIEGTDYEVQVGARSGNQVTVTVGGHAYQVELPDAAPAPSAPAPATPRPAAPTPPPAPMAAGDGSVVAPISGVVLGVKVQQGDSVSTGDLLLVLEAMKMENEIFAPCDGTVQKVAVQPQDEVRQGDPLVTIA